MARKRLVFMHRPERFAGEFIICTSNWNVCPSFCPFISPFVNYSLSLTYMYKVQYLDFGWSQSIQSKVECKFIDGLLTRQWHHICPLGFGRGQNKCMGLEYFARCWFCWHRGHLCFMNLSWCTTTLKFSIDSGSLGQSSRSFWQSTFGTLFAQHLCKNTSKLYAKKVNVSLKLYCRYLYTRPCMINHIWSLKQLWLQVNGHAWFHLQRLRWPVRNGEGAKNSKWKYMSPAGFEPTPCQSTTGKLQRLRPLGHEGLMVISG